jgi:hypothetical protein
MLAETTTGVEILDDFEPPGPDDPIDVDVLRDPYLVEPADPDLDAGEVVDMDTALKPTAAGQELLFVSSVLERWFSQCPPGTARLGIESGAALSALLSGWSSTVTHALALRPLTVAEAADAVGTLGYEGVEDCIAEMEAAGLLDAAVDEEGKTQYTPTRWLRMGTAPLAAAARLEQRHPPGDTAPISALDVGAAFLLSLPLLELPSDLSGSCSLGVDLDEGVNPSPTGVTVRIERGQLVSCDLRLAEGADAWASAPAPIWLDTVIEPGASQVRTGGESRIARNVLDALHQALFGAADG